MNALDRLLHMGFIDVGTWSLDAGCPRCDLKHHGKVSNALYAFIRGSDVLYVGKTVQPLGRRMRGYERPSDSQTTNVRGNARLIDSLTKGETVRVVALPDNGLLSYGGFHVNLAAGLEDSIVRELQPPWNITGVASSE